MKIGEYIYFIILILASICIDLNGTVLAIIACALGCGLVFLWNKSDYVKAVSVFVTMFGILWTHVIMCQLYMKSNGYQYLLAYDTIDVFLPRLQDYLSGADSYCTVLKEIWYGYDIFNRFQVGYYSFLSIWGYIAKQYGIDLYYNLQIGSISACAFISVLMYKILRLNCFQERQAQHYALLISTCSILFIYSSIILRDGIVALIFLYLIYVCHLKFKVVNLLKILLAVYICTTFRIETGLFTFIFLPIYICINLPYLKKNVLVLTGLFVLSLIAVSIIITAMSDILSLFEENYDYYSADVARGDGIIAHLQRFPVLGPVLSVLYTSLMPIPCWMKLSQVYYNVNLPEVYNVMAFPTVISSFFNVYIIFYFANYIFLTKKVHRVPIHCKALLWLLIPAGIFLLLQSAVVEQRRVMGMYSVIYLLWAIIHHNESAKNNQRIFFSALLLFLILHLLVVQIIN